MNFLVVDTETTYQRKLMTVGAVVADENFDVKNKIYLMSFGAYMQGGLYKDRVYKTALCPNKMHTSEMLETIKKFYDDNGCEMVFAYNAPFDKNLLTSLPSDKWCDIMKIAAYKQFNPYLPADEEYYGTGRLKKDYNAQRIFRLLSGNKNYEEMHNAYQDACDELGIMAMMKVPIDVYLKNARV